MIAAHIRHGSPAAAAAVAAAARAVAGGAPWELPWRALSAEWMLGGAADGEGAGAGAGGGAGILPPDAVVHITVAWAVGGLMSYLSDWYRRCVAVGGNA
jgi:hypothetical protein